MTRKQVAYIKRASLRDLSLKGRTNCMTSRTDGKWEAQAISVPNDIVVCNGCNKNLVNLLDAWWVYLRDPTKSSTRPYDIYCTECVKSLFPGAKEIAAET